MKEFIVDNHQRLGFSSIFAMATEGEEAFLPGCSFMTLGENLVLETFNILKLENPNMAIATTCCAKPSKYIKGGVKFKKRFHATIELLKSKGIKKIYVACPNCYN
ncbi:MAG: heterodisulfide reductase-related iron-sulfur binding cluster, partial [Sarcina sp.]